MFGAPGLCVDSFVRLEGTDEVSYDVIGGEVELRLGSRYTSGLDLVLTEPGLRQLVTACTGALDTLTTTG